MSLQTTLKDLEEQLAAATAAEENNEKEEQEELEQIGQEAEEPEEPEKEKEEEPEKEAEPEEKKAPQEEDPADNAAWAKMRREAAAAKRKAEEAEARLLELELKLTELQQTPVPKNEIAAPQQQVQLPPEVEEIIQKERMGKAEIEFSALENNFRKSNPGYDAIAAEYAMALAQSIKIQNRHLTQEQIVAETKKTILIKAANYLNNGYDPIEELYHEAKELGFDGRTVTRAKEASKEEKELAPDMKKVAANRERSSGMAGTSGKGNASTITVKAALGMPVQEFAKLSPDQQTSLIMQSQGL